MRRDASAHRRDSVRDRRHDRRRSHHAREGKRHRVSRRGSADMTVLPALTFGLVLGARHATDADHIAAIGTLVADGRPPQRAALTGAAWGIGHSSSVLLVGGALVMLRLPMPVRMGLALEFLAAVMLVALGVRSL